MLLAEALLEPGAERANQATGYLNTSGNGSWTTGPNRTFGGRDYGSAVMYDAGKILVVGGGGPTRDCSR